eukprot:gene8143-16736_t
MLEFLYKPVPDISYDFVAAVYFVASIICGVLLALEIGFAIDQVKGFWIVFCPFIPSLLWALYMRHQSKNIGTAVVNNKKEN